MSAMLEFSQRTVGFEALNFRVEAFLHKFILQGRQNQGIPKWEITECGQRCPQTRVAFHQLGKALVFWNMSTRDSIFIMEFSMLYYHFQEQLFWNEKSRERVTDALQPSVFLGPSLTWVLSLQDGRLLRDDYS